MLVLLVVMAIWMELELPHQIYKSLVMKTSLLVILEQFAGSHNTPQAIDSRTGIPVKRAHLAKGKRAKCTDQNCVECKLLKINKKDNINMTSKQRTYSKINNGHALLKQIDH